MGKRANTLDVGTDGWVEDQIRALSVQTIPSRTPSVEDIASLYMFPEEWKQHIAQMPTSHREFTRDR